MSYENAEKIYIRFEVREGEIREVMEKELTGKHLEDSCLSIYEQLEFFKLFLLMQGFTTNSVERLVYLEEEYNTLYGSDKNGKENH